MTPWARRGAWMAAAIALGVAGYAVLGDGPGSASDRGVVAVDWDLPDVPSRELPATDAVWELRTPWGARPATAAGEGEPEMPPLMLVGVVAAAEGARAVFILPGQGEVQAKAGDPLPDGGQVNEVTPFLVAWTDRDGTRHEQALLANPGAPLSGAEAPTSQPAPPGAERPPPPARTAPQPNRLRPAPRKPPPSPPRRP